MSLEPSNKLTEPLVLPVTNRPEDLKVFESYSFKVEEHRLTFWQLRGHFHLRHLFVRVRHYPKVNNQCEF